MSTWVAEAKAITQDWALGLDSGGHKWEGKPFSDPFVFAFQERMEEVRGVMDCPLSIVLNPVMSCPIDPPPWELSDISYSRDSRGTVQAPPF